MREIRPATLHQLQSGKNGRMIFIDDDVGNVAKSLRDADASLRLGYNEEAEYFVVYQALENADGSENHKLVFTAQELDGRIVERAKQVISEQYDFTAELERIDREADKSHEALLDDRAGDAGERLAHAMRFDLGIEKDSARSRKNWGKGGKKP